MLGRFAEDRSEDARYVATVLGLVDRLHQPRADRRLSLLVAPAARPGSERLDQPLTGGVQPAGCIVQAVEDDPLQPRVDPAAETGSLRGTGVDALDLAEAPRAHAELDREKHDGGDEQADDPLHRSLRPRRSRGTIASAANNAESAKPGRKLRVSGARTADSSSSRAVRTDSSSPAPASSKGFDRSGISPAWAFSNSSRRPIAIGTFLKTEIRASRIDVVAAVVAFVPPESTVLAISGAIAASPMTRPRWRAPIESVALRPRSASSTDVRVSGGTASPKPAPHRARAGI